jgi:pimeloyl-ACP methyl ester carboxylesterase
MNPKPHPIVFIHGMYMTPLCWEHWIDAFQAKGYVCLAPGWPGRDRPIAELRTSHPDPQLGQLTLRAIIEHYTGIIQALDDKSILVGHSMGGLIVQLLVQRDLASAAIALDSAAPQGVFTTQWPFIKSNWPHINPFAPQSQPIEMTFERFQYTFVNSMPLEKQRAAFERYVVPESRRVPAGSLTGVARVDFKKPGAPLLLIAGSNDHLIPAALVRSNYNRYRRPGSITDFKEFAGRTHFIVGQEHWEEVADFVGDWLDGQEL